VRRYYGWRVAWALAISQVVGYGVLFYAFSVFVSPMEAEFGWTRGQTSGSFSLALLLSGLIALPIGRLVDRRGARALMSVGSILGALLVLLWSTVDNLLGLYLVQAGIGLVMAAVLYEVAFTVVAVWFRRDRGRAMLLITVVAGLASTIFIPLCTVLIDGFVWQGAVLFDGLGWRSALRVLALLLAGITVPLHALVLRRHPNALGLEPDGGAAGIRAAAPERSISDRDALRGATFWWLSAAFALNRIVIIAVAAHSVPLLLERGYPPALAAAAAGSIGLMQIAGRLLFTPGSARIPLMRLTPMVFGLHALALLALLLLPGGVALWLFAALFGASNGAGTLARAALIAEIYGPGYFGGINGAMTTLIALLQTAAPLGAGLLHDRSGGYEPVLWLLIGVSLLAAVAAGRARAPRPVAA
jgi:MFS family permease